MRNCSVTPAELREQAENARWHARRLWPHEAANQLLTYAKELDEQADQLERETEIRPLEQC